MSRIREIFSAALAALAFIGLFTWVALRRGGEPRREPPPAWADDPEFSPQTSYLGEELIPPRAAPDFSLVDQDGEKVSLRTFRGRPLLLSFAYSSCTDICPALFIDFREAEQRLEKLGKLRPAQVFITLDPERDTVAQLKAVQEAYQGAWSFLTGDEAELERAWREYGVVRRPGKGGRIDHSGMVLLIDARGLIRVKYMGTPPGKVLAADAEKHVRGIAGGGR